MQPGARDFSYSVQSRDLRFTINIGQDASTLNDGSTSTVDTDHGKVTVSHTGSNGQAGGFGQRADIVKITGLSQTAYATSAGTFTLPHLSLSFTTKSC